MPGMKKAILAMGCFAILWLFAAQAMAWKGKVVEVAEGDSIMVEHPDGNIVSIVLYGIDAPDHLQPFFKRSRKFTAGKVEGQAVNVEEIVTDQNIISAIISHDGANLNEQVLQAGFAWVYREKCNLDFCPDWLFLEAQAREKKLGLWQDENPVPPWEWRKRILAKIFRVFLWVIPPWRE